MVEKRVSVRLSVVGGKEAEAAFDSLGTRGSAAMKHLGDQSEQSFQKVGRSSGAMRASLQNASYQVQDFAVQVAGGTDASRAMAQQLPQLLSGLGLVGTLMGTAAAIAIPLAVHFLGVGRDAETAAKGVQKLVVDLGRLHEANAAFSTKGVEDLIAKYGELDARIMLLVEHQRQFALDAAMKSAHDAVNGLEGGLDDVLSLLFQYDAYARTGQSRPEFLADARDAAASLHDEFGLTIDQARALQDTLERAKGANSLGEMADATAQLTTLIQGTSLKGTEFAGTLLDAEAALRQLNHEGGGIGGWLGAAIGWAEGLAASLWSGAAAAAAIHGAQITKFNTLADQHAAYGAGQSALRDRMIGDRAIYGGNGNGLTAGEEATLNPATPSGTRAGGGRSATADLEREAARMFEDTRTAAEKYDAAMQHLEEIKKAGLVSDDTYQRQLKKLAGEYGQTQSAITGLTAKLDDFVKKTEDMGTGLGDALVGAFESGGDAVAEFVRTGKLDIASLVTSMLADFARLSAEKAIFGPLAQLLSGALSGGGGILTNWLGGSASASVLHDGGMAGSAGARRAVPAGIFATAPRFHSGGWPGLRSDEVPAILQRDERVQSRAEVRAGRGGGVVNITIMARDAASFRQSQAQISADIARAVAAGRRSS